MSDVPLYVPTRPGDTSGRLFDAEALAAALARPLVFVDLETTGADAQHDRITEIGVVEVSPDGIAEWDTLLDPATSIPPFIQRLTGITNEMVRGRPTFASIAESLAERLQGKLFVAHNARFDYGFLKSEFRRAGITFRSDVLCTLQLSRALFPSVERHGLDALIARFGLQPKARHRALADADLLWQFWQQVHSRYSAHLVEAAVQTLVRRASLPAGLDDTALDDVPNTAGVYLFFGDHDAPLYIGKSIRLRQRIGAHFAGDHRAMKDLRLSRAVRRVEWRETGGEIGALLLEAQLVKQLQPVHNTLLRQTAQLFAWELPPGLATPRLRSDRDTDFSRHPCLYGAFASRGAAHERLRALAKDHELCEATLSLETTRHRGHPCFARQLHRCLGACIGTESLHEHRRRTLAALEPLSIRPWPFPSAVALREQDGGHAWWHVVDNWCYMGSVSRLDEAAQLLRQPGRFDLDTYHILAPRLTALQADAVPLESGVPAFELQPTLPGSSRRRLPTSSDRPDRPLRTRATPPGQQTLAGFEP